MTQGRRDRIAVYTCITGSYDKLLPPRLVEGAIDYICYSDTKDINVPGWEIRNVVQPHSNNNLVNRYLKMHPHSLFNEYDVSVYVDGNIEIQGGLEALVESCLKVNDIALYQHIFRQCIFEEAKVCALLGYDWYTRIEREMGRIRRVGYPEGNGLFECGVIIRRHGSPRVQQLMAAWWHHFYHGIKRDQLYLPFLCWQLNVEYCDLGPSDFRVRRKNFSLNPHDRNGRKFGIRLRGLLNRAFGSWDYSR